jgi:hypothetical protein
VAIAIGISACVAEQPVPSDPSVPHVSGEPSSSIARSPDPSAGGGAATPQPTASSAAPTEVAYTRASVVEVTRDGIGLRAGPGTLYAEVLAQRVELGGINSTDEPYRLAVGERLVINLGPVRVDGTDWYSVRPAADTFGADVFDLDFGEGWLPAAEEGVENFRPSVVRDPACCLSVAGVGSIEDTQVPSVVCLSSSPCQAVITWIAGHGDPDGICDLQITVAATGVIVDERIQGWTLGAELWRAQSPAVINVETDCSWSVHVGAA